MARKQKFYRLTNMDKIKAQYKILLGENSNGKSYAVKERCVSDAYHKGEMFIYMRRYDIDTKPSKVDTYFLDCPIESITNGEYTTVSSYKGKIYLANVTDESKIVKGKLIGYIVNLSGYEHFKSLVFPDVKNVIFEEFVTFNYYLENEPDLLQRFISIIARRREITVYMIANTISRVCPYFNEWSLKGIPTQKQGTIDTYHYDTNQVYDDGSPVVIAIAVEFCENSGNNSKMFFGKVAENITGGVWNSENQPHLSENRSKYRTLYELEFTHMGFSFVIQLLLSQSNAMLVYVYPFTKKRNIKRKISADISENPLHSTWFLANSPWENKMIELINNKKVFFSDNLTGTDFWQVYKELKRV